MTPVFSIHVLHGTPADAFDDGTFITGSVGRKPGMNQGEAASLRPCSATNGGITSMLAVSYSAQHCRSN